MLRSDRHMFETAFWLSLTEGSTMGMLPSTKMGLITASGHLLTQGAALLLDNLQDGLPVQRRNLYIHICLVGWHESDVVGRLHVVVLYCVGCRMS